MKKCSYCGHERPDDAVFCGACGNRYEEEQMPDHGAEYEGEGGEEPAEKICPRCGCRNLPDAAFCQECRWDMSEPYSENQATKTVNKNKRRGKKSVLPMAVGGIFLLIILAAGGLFGIRYLKNGSKETWSLAKAELAENYLQPENGGTVDLSARNHQPAVRDLSAVWDQTLFYWLEDAGGEDDNHIAACAMARIELKRNDNGNTIEYEVYRDSETDEIYKIVSIEHMEDGSLELSDYYYRDGKPNFVFRRSDTVYTPTYASIDKVGERYYFTNDQMVKWRWIYEPSVVNQWILTPEDTWYTQWGYQAISDGERAQYDEKEAQVLNEAYNTFDAVTANEPVVLVAGRVTNEDGEPIEGVEVGIGIIESGEGQKPEIKVMTDEEGRYAWAADDAHAEYFLVFQKKGWIQSLMKPSLIEGAQQQADQEDTVLIADSKKKEKHKVTFHVYQMKPQSEEEVTARAFAEDATEEQLPALVGADVTVYSGVNCIFGETVGQAEISEDGTVTAEFPSGSYTAVFEKEGFMTARTVFLANGDQEEMSVYSMAKDDSENGGGSASDSSDNSASGGGSQWTIVLTWDSAEEEPLDLDSSLFTPDKAAGGDRNCINTINRSDSSGGRFLYDGEGGNACEIISLTSPKAGSYKYYVSNYSDIQKKDQTSSKMADSRASVTVYHNGAPVRTFRVPEERGVIWEVFELRNENLVPVQQVYESAEGKSWWTEDKRLAKMSERNLKAGWIQSDGEWLYFANAADGNKLYYCRKDGSDLTKISDDELIHNNILLVDNQIYYTTYGTSMLAVVKINTDGTGREILKDSMVPSEESGSPLVITGYADGKLFYWHMPGTSKGSIMTVSVLGGEAVPLGNEARNFAVAGDYIFYEEVNDNYRESFWKIRLDGSEDKCLKTNMNYGYDLFTIYKGWIYYVEDGIVKKMRVDGASETVLAAGGSTPVILNDTVYYDGNDGNLHAMNMDGSGNHVVIQNPGFFSIVDGEIYTRDTSSPWSPIMVSDINGGNERQLFDTSSMRSAGAMKAYYDLLNGYVPTALVGQYERQKYIQFACQDIDGDGVNELFVQYNPGAPDLCVDYFRFDGAVRKIWDTQSAGEISVNAASKEIVAYYYAGGGRDFFDHYGFAGSYINGAAFYPGQAPDSEAELEALDRYYNTYMKGYPKLNFVDNTPANRQQYLLNGTGTGWEY